MRCWPPTWGASRTACRRRRTTPTRPRWKARSGPGRHSRAAGVCRLAGPLATRLPVRQASPGFGPDLRKRGVRSRAPRTGNRHAVQRVAAGDCRSAKPGCGRVIAITGNPLRTSGPEIDRFTAHARYRPRSSPARFRATSKVSFFPLLPQAIPGSEPSQDFRPADGEADLGGVAFPARITYVTLLIDVVRVR